MIGFIKKFLNSDFTKPLNTLIDEVKATLALIKAKTDTITAGASLTQTQANNLDEAISSRQANAGLTTTHASRIDAAISSRATDAGVWTGSTFRFTGIMGVSTTVLRSAPNEVASTYTTDSNIPWVNVTSFTLGGTGGHWRLRFENTCNHTSFNFGATLSNYGNMRLVINGVAGGTLVSTPPRIDWTWQSHDVFIPAYSSVTVQMRKATNASNGGSIHYYIRNFQLCGTGTNAIVV